MNNDFIPLREKFREVARVPWSPDADTTVVVHRAWTAKASRNRQRTEEIRSLTLKHHPCYLPAKRHGDYVAAQQIVDDLLNEESLIRIDDRLAGRKPLIVAPSLTKDDPNNVIPIWLAYNMAYQLGLQVCRDIFQHDKAHRTGRGGFYRLANEPEFYGKVIPGQDYLIVDDVVTLGGTLAALGSYIQRNGGRVAGISVLADSDVKRRVERRLDVEDFDLKVSEDTLSSLRKKHGKALESFWHDQKGYGLECLTDREAEFLRFFPSVRHIRRAFLEEQDAGSPQGGGGLSAPEPA